MPADYSAQHAVLGLSQCEQLCRKTSRDVNELARLSGTLVLPGQSLQVDLNCAIRMAIIETAKSYGVEPVAIRSHLPGLQDEVRLILGVDRMNWSFDGEDADSVRFFNQFWKSPDEIERFVAPILKCSMSTAITRLCFYSGANIVAERRGEERTVHPGQSPIFVIYPPEIAARIRAALSGVAFTASVKTNQYAL